MLLLIDNYDSFTYNLVQYLGELGAEMEVVRNDKISVAEIGEMAPSHIVISPGPCTPDEAGVSVELVKALGPRVPILGVCLGHQSIAQAYGGVVVRAPAVAHGKTSPIFHRGKGLFEGIESPLTATRYHSLVVERATLPDCLNEIAWTEGPEGADKLIMGLMHREHPVHSLQFHPESILTETGKQLLANFLKVKRP